MNAQVRRSFGIHPSRTSNKSRKQPTNSACPEWNVMPTSSQSYPSFTELSFWRLLMYNQLPRPLNNDAVPS